MLFDKTFGSVMAEKFDIKMEENQNDDFLQEETIEETDSVDNDEISDDELEESIIFDDESFELFESACDQEEDKIECQKSYEDMKKDAFAFGATNDQIDGMIDKHLGQDAPDTVPDNVNILGSNTDDFEYDENNSQDMDDDEDIDIVIDDEDIYDSDDK